MSASAITLTAENFEQEVTNFKGVVLVDYGAGWCPPCRAMEPRVEALSEKYADDSRVKIVNVDVDADQEFTATQDVYNLPTFRVFANGEVVNQVPGLIPPAQLEALLLEGIAKLA